MHGPNRSDGFLRPAKSHLELSEDFRACDTNHDGRIDLDEFMEFLDCLDVDIADTQLLIGFRQIDKNRDGMIDFGEFLAWWREQ